MGQPKFESNFPQLGIGLGLRPDHYRDITSGTNDGHKTTVSWFEALSDNYMDEGGRPLHFLTKVRELHPVVLHGVSLSIASVDPLNTQYLQKLKTLAERIEPSIISDHCCWTGFNGQNLHDLMPVPFTLEAAKHISSRVQQVQDFLGRRILLENVSSYLNFKNSEMTEWEFLTEILKTSDCGLLLDVNNVYVSSVNHGFDPLNYIRGIPAKNVGQIHLAGHSTTEAEDGSALLIDTHDAPVCDEVWNLYRETTKLLGPINTMVEWDAEIPSYERLTEEVHKAHLIQEEILGKK